MSGTSRIFVIGIGQMGGELIVGRRIVALMRQNYLTKEIKIDYPQFQSRLATLVTTFWQSFSIFKSEIKSSGISLYSSDAVVVMAAITYSFLNKVKFNIFFHYHGTKATPYTAFYKNPLKWFFYKMDHELACWVIRKMEQHAIKKADAVIVPARSTYQKLKKMVQGSLLYLPSSVDVKVFAPTTQVAHRSRRKLKIGYIGRITREKGVFELVNAAVMVNLDVKLHITHVSGVNDHLLLKLQQLAYSRALDLQVHYDLTQGEVADLISSFDLTTLPSYSEHLPLSLLESLACEVPVLATTAGDCKYVLEQVDNRLILKDNTPSTIAAKMWWWSELPQSERAAIKKKARVIAMKYSFEHFETRAKYIFSKLTES